MRATEEGIFVRKATDRDSDGIINVLKSTKLGEETWKGNEIIVKRILLTSLNDKNFATLVAEINSQLSVSSTALFSHHFWNARSKA